MPRTWNALPANANVLMLHLLSSRRQPVLAQTFIAPVDGPRSSSFGLRRFLQ